MKPYKNMSGNSGILAYEGGPDFIKVKFSDGEVYRYDHSHPGKMHVENMKFLAALGKGLATYISKYIKTNFAEKL